MKNNYAEIEQRWLVIESEKRKKSDIEKLRKKIEKEKEKIEETLTKLMKEEFSSSEVAEEIVLRLNKTLKSHEITEIKTRENKLKKHNKKIKNTEKIRKNLSIDGCFKIRFNENSRIRKKSRKICFSHK